VPYDAPRRKRRHLEACLEGPVTYRTRTTGFETVDLPYRAAPETDLAEIDTRTTFLGRPMAAPLLIGAMTGGARWSATLNRNLAIAAQRVGVGLMLGSQRVMLEDPSAAASFEVRPHAPDVPIVGNLGVAQLNRGYGPDEVRRAVDAIGADGLALHANPLQEAVQEGGDGDFRSLLPRLATLPAEVGRPLLLKEVGHGLDPGTVAALAEAGFAAFDVAGAGGTSWARVEAYVRWGEIRSEDLVEWGIPTLAALRAARSVAPGLPLVASGGVRSGLDVAKALACGASWCAVALPLLRPATESPEAVEGVLRRFVWELRIAMHAAGAADLDALRRVTPLPRGETAAPARSGVGSR
jgi:isopentenyl-diphosphate delta-isomerase